MTRTRKILVPDRGQEIAEAAPIAGANVRVIGFLQGFIGDVSNSVLRPRYGSR